MSHQPSEATVVPRGGRSVADHLRRGRATFFSAVVAGLCGCCIIFLRLKLWQFDLKVPISYWGDALYFEVLVKQIAQGGWVHHIPRLGAPFGMDAVDFPLGCDLYFAIIKCFSIFVHNPSLLINLYWLFSLGLAGALAAVFLRSLEFGVGVSTVFGAIYAVIPFGLYRNIGHLNLVHFVVPMAAYLATETARGRTFDFANCRRLWPRCAWGRLLIPVLLCVAIGLTFIYWAFFACWLVAISCMFGMTRHSKLNVLAATTLYIGIMGATAVADITPSLIYWTKHGRNAELAYRSPAETDVYGLRIRQMCMPIQGHPIPLMDEIRNKIVAGRFLHDANETSSSALGTIGVIGFLLLIWITIVRPTKGILADPRLGLFSALTVSVILIAETGGFGSLFNCLFIPDFRDYNRMSPFVSLFACGAIAALIDPLSRRLTPAVSVIFGILLLVFAALDQVPVVLFSKHNLDARKFYRDHQYFSALERRLAPKAMIFQLPHTEFPADPGRHTMLPYDNARPYLHTKQLRWSWGSMSGRHHNWARTTANLPPAQLLDAVSAAGFGGILLDRYGYGEQTLEKYLTANAEPGSIFDSGGEWVFFKLRANAQDR